MFMLAAVPTTTPAESEPWSTGTIIVLVFVLIVMLVILAIMGQFIGLYVRAAVSGAHVGFMDLLGMRLRKVNAMSIVYSDVLENPDHISKAVLHKGLDANTAFEILSIDIADIDAGENIGAKLAAERAESDKRRFQAEAEQRRAMAVAAEQENVAKQAENRAAVVLAEAEVPRAIADAFRNGHLGVLDYYKLKNVQADTSMREAIARPADGNKV